MEEREEEEREEEKREEEKDQEELGLTERWDKLSCSMAARHGAGEEDHVLPTFHVAIAGWDPLSRSGRGIERALEEAQERMSGAKSRQRAMEESEKRWKVVLTCLKLSPYLT